jgi:hypothetical protein
MSLMGIRLFLSFLYKQSFKKIVLFVYLSLLVYMLCKQVTRDRIPKVKGYKHSKI